MSITVGTDPSPLVECGGAGGTAGTYTEILDQFDTDDYSEDAIQSLAVRYLLI